GCASRDLCAADYSFVLIVFSASYCVLSDFFSHSTATTGIYSLSLHDALPICNARTYPFEVAGRPHLLVNEGEDGVWDGPRNRPRSEEHTSELQSRSDLVCRLLLEKKKT